MEPKPLVEVENVNNRTTEPLADTEKTNGKESEPLVSTQKVNGRITEASVEESDNINGHKSELQIRQLEKTDYAKGFVELLGQLSACPSLSKSQFEAHFADLAALGDTHHIAVAEDTESGRIVATGSVFIEKKFLRGCSSVAHIEDVVVDKTTRGAHLGRRIVDYLVERARDAGCYKVILDCAPEVRRFYEKCGFVEKNVQMAMYF